MTKFDMNFSFEQDMSGRGEASQWAEAIQGALPEGSTVEIKARPVILDVSEVTDEHAGNNVTIRGYYKPVVQKIEAEERSKGNLTAILEQRNLHGVLEHVFPSGGSEFRRTFVIDGKAYDIPAYSLVELTEV